MTSNHDELSSLLGPFLTRQRWFAGSGEDALQARLVTSEEIHAGPPDLLWLLAEAAGVTYQILLGLRPEEEALSLSQEGAILGILDGDRMAYDAIVDPELAMVLLDIVTAGAEHAERVRPVGAEQSNTSLVYDDRVILKVFRRLQAGPNPDVEVTLALDDVGFNHLAAPLGHWRRNDLDLALAQEFLHGGSEGWALALTSLRDLYASADEAQAESAPPEVAAAAGGDFGAEARRLGEMTARLHLAMARAFGVGPGQPDEGAEGVTAQLGRARSALAAAAPRDGEALAATFADLPTGDGSGTFGQLLARLRTVGAVGAQVRIHGDYHLGQVMRTDQGWFVLDFEGEPVRALAERRRHQSPLKDVAGMLRSLDYASAVALRDRDDAERVMMAGLDRAWVERNRASFLQGYLSTPEIDGLLPPQGQEMDVVLRSFEVEKAAYELAYELAYRPAWAEIPARALARLL